MKDVEINVAETACSDLMVLVWEIDSKTTILSMTPFAE
jgi:hypothetical protein